MSQQRQHVLVSYFKTLSVGPAWVWTLTQLSWPGDSLECNTSRNIYAGIQLQLHCNSLLIIAFVSLTASFLIQTMIPIAHYFINSYKLFFIDNEKIWQEKIDFGHSWHSRLKQLENLFSLIFIYSCWRGRSFWGIKTGTGDPHPWRHPILPWLYCHSR